MFHPIYGPNEAQKYLIGAILALIFGAVVDILKPIVMKSDLKQKC